MAEPGQVVGGRQTARPGADHEHPLAAADRGRVELPPLLQREVAEEPLDRMDRDGAVEARRGCRRSRTGGSRPARGSRAADCPRRAGATPARAGPPGCATARPGCSRRPGSRRCTAAAGRRRRGGAPGPGRCGSARAAGPAAASRPASGRSCQSPRSDSHGPRLTRFHERGCGSSTGLCLGGQARVRAAGSEIWRSSVASVRSGWKKSRAPMMRHRSPEFFAEVVSISSTRSAGVSDSAYFIKSIELRPTFDLFLGAR